MGHEESLNLPLSALKDFNELVAAEDLFSCVNQLVEVDKDPQCPCVGYVHTINVQTTIVMHASSFVCAK